MPIVRGGRTFTDWGGRPTIRGGNAISTNGLLFDQVMRMVREEVKQNGRSRSVRKRPLRCS
jgi:hypothetical protein